MLNVSEQARDDYFRGGQLEGVPHRGNNGSNNQSSRSSAHHSSAHQFGPAAADCGKLQSGMVGRGALVAANQPPRKHKRPGNAGPPEVRLHQQHQQHISFSSSEEELRSTSECTSCDEHESEKGNVSVLRPATRVYMYTVITPLCLTVTTVTVVTVIAVNAVIIITIARPGAIGSRSDNN